MKYALNCLMTCPCNLFWTCSQHQSFCSTFLPVSLPCTLLQFSWWDYHRFLRDLEDYSSPPLIFIGQPFLERPLIFLYFLSFVHSVKLSSKRRICTHSSACISGCSGCSFTSLTLFHAVQLDSVVITLAHLLRANQPLSSVLFNHSAFQTLICATHILPISTSSWSGRDLHSSLHLLQSHQHQHQDPD